MWKRHTTHQRPRIMPFSLCFKRRTVFVTSLQKSNKACCLNMHIFFPFLFPNNPTPTSCIPFCRGSGTSSLYLWLPPSLKNLATPVREELFPPADPSHPQSEWGGRRGPYGTLQPRKGAPNLGKVKKLL